MSINLAPYLSVESGLFIKITIDNYRTDPTQATGTQQILRFSDYNRTVTVNGESYTGIGRLMNITPTSSELRSASSSVTVSLAGIPNSSIAEILWSDIKGSPIEVWRMLFSSSGQPLNIPGNPVGRFFGIVNNYTLEESYDVAGRSSSNNIVLTCSSVIEVLSNKVSGRRTNPIDQKKLYPSDLSMDRVNNLSGSNFNFGAPV